MPITESIIFFSKFLIVLLILYLLYCLFRNLAIKPQIKRFLEDSNSRNPVVIYDIKLSYWIKSGYKYYVSIRNYCDIYIFDNFFVIVRKQKIIFDLLFPPMLFVKSFQRVTSGFEYINHFEPEIIKFSKVVKGQIEIKIIDPVYEHRKIEIIIKGLTNEQMEKVEKVWENS